MADNLTPETIGSLFAECARIGRFIDFADAHARKARTEAEKFDWIMVAANLRAERNDVFRSIDNLVWKGIYNV